MTLEWLVAELKKIDSEMMEEEGGLMKGSPFGDTQEFYSVILNKDGTCIAHPDGKRVTMVDDPIVSDLEQKKSGVVDMKVNGISSTVYYGPIDYIDWSVAVIVPKQMILNPLLFLGLIFILISIAGVLVIWWIVRRGKMNVDSA